MPPKPADRDTKSEFCKKKLEEQKCHLMIECDCCNLWFHSICQNLTKTEASFISEGEEKGIRWCCTICSSNTVIIKSSKNIIETTNEKLEAITKSIKVLND